MKPIYAPLALGELVDKLSILNIKTQFITDPEKLKNVFNERDALMDALLNSCTLSVLHESDYVQLSQINEILWMLEDRIRQTEDEREELECSRQIRLWNRKRAEVKRAINELYESELKEEKQYA